MSIYHLRENNFFKEEFTMNSSDRRKHSCTNFGVIGKGNDQEIEFQKIEIGVFQEIEIIH